jgi:hypothetical protein
VLQPTRSLWRGIWYRKVNSLTVSCDKDWPFGRKLEQTHFPVPLFKLFVFGATALSWPGPPHSRGFLITHDSPQSVALLWTSEYSSSQRPLPDNTQHSQQTNVHAPVGFEPTPQQASCRRPRGHCDRLF